MGDLTKGYTFVAGEIVTAAKLHALVESAEILADAVGTTEIADGAVTSAKLNSAVALAVSKITLAENKVVVGNASGIGGEILVDATTMDPAGFGVKALGIAAAQLASDAVTTAKILDANVTLAKIANIATARILGRSTAASGVIEELTAGTGISISGGAVSCSITGATKGDEILVALNGTTGVLGTGSHGLGGRPRLAWLALRCITDELTYTGYSAGDEIPIANVVYDGGDYDIPAIWCTINETTYSIGRLYMATDGGLYIPKKSDGVLVNLSSGNEAKFSVSLNLWR